MSNPESIKLKGLKVSIELEEFQIDVINESQLSNIRRDIDALNIRLLRLKETIEKIKNKDNKE